jgi:hypothetical protein
MQSKNSHINQVPHPFAWPMQFKLLLIARAAKKVYLHRIVLVGPEDDRRLQYGNNPNSIFKDAGSDSNVIGECS